jgi:hypothetical protein
VASSAAAATAVGHAPALPNADATSSSAASANSSSSASRGSSSSGGSSSSTVKLSAVQQAVFDRKALRETLNAITDSSGARAAVRNNWKLCYLTKLSQSIVPAEVGSCSDAALLQLESDLSDELARMIGGSKLIDQATKEKWLDRLAMLELEL